MRIDLGIVRWTQDGKAGIEFIRMAGDDQLRLRFYVGHIDKRRPSSSSWTEARSAWAIEMSQVDVRERERLLNTVLLCCTPYRGTRRGQGPSL